MAISNVAKSALASCIAGGALVASSPASASQSGGWTTSDRGGACWIETYPDGGGLLFALSIRAEGSYSMSGLAFERYTETGEAPDRIEVSAGEDSTLLLGPQDEMRESARRWASIHPVDAFAETVEGKNEFTLDVDGKLATIPLAGFARARESFEECRKDLEVQAGPRPPRQIAFDGINQLGAAAARQRLLSEVIGYTLTVDADGKAVDCELSRSFRRKAVTLSLCRPLMKHSRFEPARDAMGNAVPGKFSSEIDFDMWMTQRGYLEAEDR